MQELFSKIVTHLREQGQCVDGDGDCRYRFEGKSCAAGVVLPFYRPSMEHKNIKQVNAEYRMGFKDDEVKLLMRMQDIHDSSVIDWEDEWAIIAKEYELEMP